MRAKILMLTDSVKSKALMRVVQQALNDIAVAFGHSFIMKDQQMDSQHTILPELGEYQAVMAVGSEKALLETFDPMWRINTLKLPSGLADFSLLRIPHFPVITLISPMRDGMDSAIMAASAALRIASDNNAMVWAVSSAVNTGDFTEAMNRAAGPYALSSPEALPVEAVIGKPLQHPDKDHVFFADQKTAGLILALFKGLSGAGLSHGVYGKEHMSVHLAGGVPGMMPGLFDALYMTVDALDTSLSLKKEAGCLQASVDNVLASGWRARDMDIIGESAGDDQIAALIGEQIELAGSLMQRFPS